MVYINNIKSANEKETDMNKDLKLTLAYILTEASNEDLTSIYEAIDSRRAQLARVNRYTLRVGSKVKFSSRGVDYSGVIKSIKIKKAAVDVGTNIYNVPLNMLNAA